MTNRRKRRRVAARSVPLAIKERILRETINEVDRGTAERAQHDQVAGVAQSYVVSRVAQLYAAGRIDAAGRDACGRFYRDWALGVMRVQEPPSGLGGSASPDAGELRHLVAARRYRQVREALGDRVTVILTWLVCEDRSWSWMAGRLAEIEGEWDRDLIQEAAVACIKMLGELRVGGKT